MMRTFGDERIRELAKHCEVPVINGLTDGGHPVQILTDLLTIEERLGRLKGTTIAFVGDTGSNMGRSFTEGASLFGYTLKLASPPGYHPADDVVRLSKDRVQLLSDPRAAVEGADAVVTDVWNSMGQDEDGSVTINGQSGRYSRQATEALGAVQGALESRGVKVDVTDKELE